MYFIGVIRALRAIRLLRILRFCRGLQVFLSACALTPEKLAEGYSEGRGLLVLY